MLRYTLLRILIFFGVLALLWLLGLRDRDEQLILVVAAALVSMVISYFALRPFREEYSRQIAQRLEARAAAKQQRDADEAAEDAEAGRGEDGGPPQYR
jgi:hypothetical protein